MEIFDRTTNELCSMNEEEIAALAQKIINENDGCISVDDFMRILKDEHNFNDPKEYKSWCEELGLKEIETFKEEN